MSSPFDVFLIEDHASVRAMLRRLVEREDDLCVSGEAGSAEEALRLLPPLTPDLLMIDLSLPGMSGLDLLRRLRDDRPALRTLVVTGHDDVHHRRAALAAGAHGFVAKDRPEVILSALWGVLDG